MSLDILTLKGQESWRDEQRLAAWLEQNFKFRYVQTPKHVSATVDAVLIGANHALIGVAETKCRYNLDMNEFKTAFKQEWLMTWNKVNYAMKIATGLGVPLVGFLFLVKPSVVLVIQMESWLLKSGCKPPPQKQLSTVVMRFGPMRLLICQRPSFTR
jgi:hypothetical protein